MVQFEVTAARNGSFMTEKTSALLCALDGPARSILLEWDDPTAANFKEIKEVLLKRFGCSQLLQTHERALEELHFTKYQAIQDIARDSKRLVWKAYPELDERTRERFSVKTLVRAINDKSTAFYIKEKDPKSLQEVCDLYT